MQKLGQHFLKNAAILEKIVGALALANGETLIEIGPGHGELTMPLARAARGAHCKIFCIEKDHALIEHLRLFATQENSAPSGKTTDARGGARINIIEGDALKLLPEITKKIGGTHSAARDGDAPYKIVGNIPYYITGKLLRVMSELEKKPEMTVLLVQKEVAERICAAPPDMNRLAASVQFWADAKIVAHVPRNDFSPSPEVDSAVIVLKTKTPRTDATVGQPPIDPALYYRAVREMFAQPRKTLLNNLSASTGGAAAKTKLVEQLKKLGIDPEARPQDMGIGQIIAIARMDLWQ